MRIARGCREQRRLVSSTREGDGLMRTHGEQSTENSPAAYIPRRLAPASRE